MIDWMILGLLLDGVGAVLVLGTGVSRVRAIFESYHPQFREARNMILQSQLSTIYKDDAVYPLFKELLARVSVPDHSLDKAFFSQYILIDDSDEFVASIPSHAILPEDFPKHSQEELKRNIALELADKKGINLSEYSDTPVHGIRCDSSQIQTIKPVPAATPDHIFVNFVPSLPSDYSNIREDLPILKTEIYDYERIREAYADYLDSIMLRTGGFLLALGFVLQILAQDTIQKTIGRLFRTIFHVIDMLPF